MSTAIRTNNLMLRYILFLLELDVRLHRKIRFTLHDNRSLAKGQDNCDPVDLIDLARDSSTEDEDIFERFRTRLSWHCGYENAGMLGRWARNGKGNPTAPKDKLTPIPPPGARPGNYEGHERMVRALVEMIAQCPQFLQSDFELFIDELECRGSRLERELQANFLGNRTDASGPSIAAQAQGIFSKVSALSDDRFTELLRDVALSSDARDVIKAVRDVQSARQTSFASWMRRMLTKPDLDEFCRLGSEFAARLRLACYLKLWHDAAQEVQITHTGLLADNEELQPFARDMQALLGIVRQRLSVIQDDRLEGVAKPGTIQQHARSIEAHLGSFQAALSATHFSDSGLKQLVNSAFNLCGDQMHAADGFLEDTLKACIEDPFLEALIAHTKELAAAEIQNAQAANERKAWVEAAAKLRAEIERAVTLEQQHMHLQAMQAELQQRLTFAQTYPQDALRSWCDQSDLRQALTGVGEACPNLRRDFADQLGVHVAALDSAASNESFDQFLQQLEQLTRFQADDCLKDIDCQLVEVLSDGPASGASGHRTPKLPKLVRTLLVSCSQ